MLLNCHSYYSLRYGTIKPVELLHMASKCSMNAVALTDINNTSGCLDFIRLSSKYNVKPIIGVDFRNKAKQQFIALAKNNNGFLQINNYLSEFLHQGEYTIPSKATELEDNYIIYPFDSYTGFELGNQEFLGVKITDLNRIPFTKWNRLRDKLVILHTVSFQNKKAFNTHRLLRAIDNNTLLSKLPIEEQGHEHDRMLMYDELIIAYKEFPELIDNTKSILDNCNVDFDFSKKIPNNQRSYTNNEVLDYKFLERLTYSGLPYRYSHPDTKIFNRIKKELHIIKEKGFVSYFLINWKILKYARSKGYYYVGRGSGANSIVAYLLRITDVDPIELDLYFERFINLYRTNPPDFDIDFSWVDRDDVTEFIFKRFKHTALLAVYNTFKHRAAVRELGKVFGLPKSEIDMLSSGRFNYGTLDKLSQLVVTYSKYIIGFPNYLGLHASGIIISERPVHYYTSTFLPPKGFSTTTIDMVVAEDIGLFKFDILSQRGLGKIKEAVKIAEYNNPTHPKIDIHDFQRFKKDERIKYLLKNAKAIGCFYVESPAMRMLLVKLRVDNYLGLVAASSVIRPGVSKSGMMRQYILRYRKPERRNDAHPTLLNIMPDTYGVMVYQEDVIKVAHYYGGLSLGEADMLRRGMSGKFRSRNEFLKVKEQFFVNCKKRGENESLTADIWRQIESFAGYAFAKGHSASYAVESYQSLYLKAYYPLEYMVATINNGGGFYRPELYVHEARMHGGIIEAPCINNSFQSTSIQEKIIYLGFNHLHAFESKIGERLVNERLSDGPYCSFDNFLDRVPIPIEQLVILIKINAFRFTGINKRELLWNARMKVNKVVAFEKVVTLFKTEVVSYDIPKLPCTELEDAFDEIELLGYPLCNPFKLIDSPLESQIRGKDLHKYIKKFVTVEGYYVTAKNTSTHDGKAMHFGTFLDVEGDFIDTVHFPPIAAKYPFRGRGVYRITGRVLEEFDAISIEVTQMFRIATIEDPRYSDKDNKAIV